MLTTTLDFAARDLKKVRSATHAEDPDALVTENGYHAGARTPGRRLIHFRARFVVGEDTIQECGLAGLDEFSAIVEALDIPWPAKATALKVVRWDNIEVFERLRADR